MSSIIKVTGITLAIAAAGLASGCNSMGDTKMSAKSSDSADVHCFGVNKCKGHNDCKTASNSCKGMASCSGKGFLKMSEKACGDVGGKVG